MDSTFNDYKLRVRAAYNNNPGWRYGQTIFNVLCKMRPDLSEQIRATKLDPFYSDHRPKHEAQALQAKCFEWIASNW